MPQFPEIKLYIKKLLWYSLVKNVEETRQAGMSETSFRVVETETRTKYVYSIDDDGVDDEI